MSDGYLSKDREYLARLQRERRARMRRMDYMPGPHALAVIEARRAKERQGSVAATNSAVIDDIVTKWAAMTGIKYGEIAKLMTPVRRAVDPNRSARARVNDSHSVCPELMQPSRACAGAYESDGEAGISRQVRARACEFGAVVAENSREQTRRVICAAKRHRDGQPCQALSEPGKRRCRFHGGRSTGPRTDAGKARALANLRRPNRAGQSGDF